MSTLVYAEDVFSSFYYLVHSNKIAIQHQDFSPVVSFFTKITDDGQITRNQANYIIKLLEKYKNLSAMAGFDYRGNLADLQWKQPFRVLDLSKTIYAEQNKNGGVDICLKFPFQLKKEFDEKINIKDFGKSNRWDPDDKVRRLNLYDFNLISLYEFAVEHNFQIEESFMNVLADVEEIWQNSDDIVPYSELTNLGVQLKNSNDETNEWWTSLETSGVANDLLLAKSMGFPLRKKPSNLVEKIAASTENTFWVKNNSDFFSVTESINGKICIILDRASNTLEWLRNFVESADKNGVSRDEIKVCFRETKESKSGINEWIKLAGVGGKVENGKFLIFESKPAKWLFKDQLDVKILVTNNIYPPTNTMSREWFHSHPCVIYLGETKPTEQRGQKIVEL